MRKRDTSIRYVFRKCTTFAGNIENKMRLPNDFIIRTRLLLQDSYEDFESSLTNAVPVSVRMNRTKTARIPVGDKIPWCDTGYYIPERPSFTFDPLFHAGSYYVQEASSMFLEQVIRAYVNQPVVGLDLCAAPGGKSTHLQSVLPEGSLLVSNEVIRSRANILKENIIKWGSSYSVVTNNDPSEFGKIPGLFNLIVADVPCSGEGMFRKDPESIKEWSVENVQVCASRQKRIVQDVWNSLQPGGLFIYSTCTYNTEENEENIHYIVEELGAEVLSIPVEPTWEISGPLKYNYPVYRFFPYKIKGEGFFMAILRKNINEDKIDFKAKTFKNKKKEKAGNTLLLPKEMNDWLLNPADFVMERKENFVYAFPVQHAQLINQLRKELRVLHSGILLGEVKGKDLIPSHALALNTSFRQDAFQRVDVDKEDAIRFLRKETFAINTTLEKGYVVVYYEETPLGFIKYLGNRSNNLYPSEWRIRSSYGHYTTIAYQ